MPPISFARGDSRARVPPGRGARRLRARRDRARRAGRCSRTARAAATAAARVARRAARGRALADPAHERLAPGLRLPRRTASPARAFPRRGADLRPAAEDPARARRRRRRGPQDDEGLDPDAVEAALDGPALLYTIPTFQNPSGRTLSTERRRRRRARARARPAALRGRPLRPRPLRGRAAADALRAGRRRADDLQLVVLEDDRARRPRRLLRPARRPRARARGDWRPRRTSRRCSCPRRRSSSSSAAAPSSRTSSASAACSARAATRCSRRSSSSSAAARPGAGPRAATSSGSTSASRPAELLERAEADGVTFVKGSGLLPAGRGRRASRAARVQLRLDGRDRRGRRAPRGARAGRRVGLDAGRRAARPGRGTSVGCFGGTSAPRFTARKVGQIVACEGAEARAPEVAIIAGWLTCLAHYPLVRPKPLEQTGVESTTDRPGGSTAAVHENGRILRPLRTWRNLADSAPRAAGLPAPATPVEKFSQG